MPKTPDRILWPDLLRGFCMVAILLFHTEVYAAGQEIIPYNLYVCDALIAFFLVSGYLYHSPDRPFSLRHKVARVMQTLVMPYFIFSLLLLVPKTFAHGGDATLSQGIANIFMGKASWFVAALAVAQILFGCLMKLTRHYEKYTAIACLTAYMLVAVAYNGIHYDLLKATNLWCWQNAMLSLPFFCMGHCLRRHPSWLDKLKKTSTMAILALAVATLKATIHANSLPLTLEPINVSSFALLLADGTCTALLLTALTMHLPHLPLITWTGSHTIVYYFFCGAVPATMALALKHTPLAYDGHYTQIIVTLLIVYIITTAIAWTIYRFFPQSIGKKRG